MRHQTPDHVFLLRSVRIVTLYKFAVLNICYRRERIPHRHECFSVIMHTGYDPRFTRRFVQNNVIGSDSINRTLPSCSMPFASYTGHNSCTAAQCHIRRGTASRGDAADGISDGRVIRRYFRMCRIYTFCSSFTLLFHASIAFGSLGTKNC